MPAAAQRAAASVTIGANASGVRAASGCAGARFPGHEQEPLSSLRMVPRPWLSAIGVLALDRLTKKVSLGSTIRSPLTVTVIVLLVCPPVKVSVPLVAM